MVGRGNSNAEIAIALGRTKPSISWRKTTLKQAGVNVHVATARAVEQAKPQPRTIPVSAGFVPQPAGTVTKQVNVPEALASRVIGTGGVNISAVIKKHSVTIAVKPGYAEVKGQPANVDAAIAELQDMMDPPAIGTEWKGKVVGHVATGCLVQITPVYRGLLPSSEYSKHGDLLVGDEVDVYVDGVNFEQSKFILKLQPSETETTETEHIEAELENIGKVLVKKTGNPLGVASFLIAMGLDIMYTELGKGK
jgi:RecJ-like exonuclease